MLSFLFSRAWWSAAGLRALRTAIVTLAPFVPALVDRDTTALWSAVSTVALAVVLSLATSWASLPEVDGLPRPWWAATLDRLVRTFAQVLVAGIPAVTLIQDVPWSALVTNAAAAAVGSLLLAAIARLPETIPVAPVVDDVAQITTLPPQVRTEIGAAAAGLDPDHPSRARLERLLD